MLRITIYNNEHQVVAVLYSKNFDLSFTRLLQKSATVHQSVSNWLFVSRDGCLDSPNSIDCEHDGQSTMAIQLELNSRFPFKRVNRTRQVISLSFNNLCRMACSELSTVYNSGILVFDNCFNLYNS